MTFAKTVIAILLLLAIQAWGQVAIEAGIRSATDALQALAVLLVIIGGGRALWAVFVRDEQG